MCRRRFGRVGDQPLPVRRDRGRPFLRLAEPVGGSIFWRLIDPYGRQVWFSSFTDTDRQTLTGTYTLLVEGYVSNGSTPITYSFNPVKVIDTTAALTLGAQVNASVTQPGSATSSPSP